MNTFRINGKNALSHIISDKHIVDRYEKSIYDTYKNTENTELEYTRAIYQIVGSYIENNDLSEIDCLVKNNNLGWEHPHFQPAIDKLMEQDDFIINPFDVEDGAMECKCGSKKVFSYSKQTRAADEPMTTFAQCVECNNKWIYNG